MAEDPPNRTSESDSSPDFDPLSIEFPTDTLAVRDLIDQFPNEFTWKSDSHRQAEPSNFDPFNAHHKAFFNLRMAMSLERELAQLSYQARRDGVDQLGGFTKDELTTLDGGVSRQELVEWLDGHYQVLGVTTGPKQTAELVRRLESQAAEQAGPERSA